VDALAVQLPLGQTRAAFAPQTLQPAERTVELVWTTGARVRRAGWDGPWMEELSLAEGAVDLGRLNRGANLLAAHDSWSLDGILGVVEWARLEDRGDGTREGRALVRFSQRAQAAAIFEDVQAGIIRNVSVGYITHALDQIEKADRKTGSLDVYQATRWEPVELSLCAVPADAGAQVRSADDTRRYACSVRRIAMGQDTTTTVEQPTRRKAATRPTRAEEERPPGEPKHEPPDDEGEEYDEHEGKVPPPPPPPEKEHGDLAAAEAERSRIQTIHRRVRAAGLDHAVADRLIDAGTPEARIDREVFAELERRQPQVSRSAVDVVSTGGDRMKQGIINALLHRVSPVKYPLEPEGKNFVGRSLMELGREVLEAGGIRTRGLGRMELAAVALGLAHPTMKREGPHGFLATSDLPALLATIGRTTLTAGYTAAPRTFPPWTRQGTLPDFRVTNRVSLGLGPKLVKVPEHAEYTRGKLAAVGQPIWLDVFGRILAFTRQAMINDDVGLFNRIPQMFGSSAAAMEGDAVYGILIANPPMADGFALFSTQHANLMAASVIDLKNVALARQAMLNQKTPDGQFLGVVPQFMICGPLQEVYALQFLAPITLVGAFTQVVPSAYKQMQLIVDPRITDYSWYLAADPNQIDTIEYAYLEGSGATGPMLETREGWDIDGQEYKAREEFGAAAIDYRGLVKNPGSQPAILLQAAPEHAPAPEHATRGRGE
jgi:hypothetical protein